MTTICPATNVVAASLTSILCYQTSHFPITHLRFIYLFIQYLFRPCSAPHIYCVVAAAFYCCSLSISYVCALLKGTPTRIDVSLYSEASWKM